MLIMFVWNVIVAAFVLCKVGGLFFPSLKDATQDALSVDVLNWSLGSSFAVFAVASILVLKNEHRRKNVDERCQLDASPSKL